MDNTIDFFRDVCNTFRITPGAEKFIFGDNKVMESLPGCVSKTFSQDWSIKVSALNPKETIFPILKRAEDSLGTILAEKNTLLSILDIEQRFTTAEVIIITKVDNGKTIPVYNRNWLLLSSEDKTKHSIMTECIIPYPENDYSELGCYIPYSGTVLLWIDRISEAAKRNNMDTELLFQKVLLHELIHAVLDCNVRDEKLDVYRPDDNVHGIEETLDNFLVLKCYEESIATSFFGTIENFISNQPSNYALARDVFEIISSGHLWIEYEGFITTFLSCKISGTVKSKDPLYFLVDPNPDDDYDYTPQVIISSTTNEVTGQMDCCKGDFMNSDYKEYQSLPISCHKPKPGIEIEGECFDIYHVDYISDITIRNNIKENTVRAVYILKNRKNNDFIICSHSFNYKDEHNFNESLTIIGVKRTRAVAYSAADEGFYQYHVKDIGILNLLSCFFPDGIDWF